MVDNLRARGHPYNLPECNTNVHKKYEDHNKIRTKFDIFVTDETVVSHIYARHNMSYFT